MKISLEIELPGLPWTRRGAATPTAAHGPAGPMGPMGARGAPGRFSDEERERLSESWEQNAEYLDEVWKKLNNLELHQGIHQQQIMTINQILTDEGHDLFPRHDNDDHVDIEGKHDADNGND